MLDASALLALLWAEDGAPVVRSVLERAERDATPCPMTVVNWGEVVYTVAQRRGPAAVPRLIETMDGLPIALVEIDRDLALAAAMLKARQGLGYADSLCAALARALDAPVLTCDSDFDALDDVIEVRRIR